MKAHRSPLSIHPIENLENQSQPYALTEESAKIWFGIGLGGGIGLVGLGALSQYELLKVKELIIETYLTWFLLAALLLLTARFSYKQWCYYFRKSGVGKEGIFVQTIGIVNRLEETTDIILSFWGGLLLASSTLPYIWIIVLSCYTFIVFLRSLFILLRTNFSIILSNKGVSCPVQYSSSLNQYHNDYWVPAVLWGWLIIHGSTTIISVIIAVSFFAAKNIYSTTGSVILLIGSVITLMGALFLLSDLSYRLGIRIAPETITENNKNNMKE